jgi:hypothetical protein
MDPNDDQRETVRLKGLSQIEIDSGRPGSLTRNYFNLLVTAISGPFRVRAKLVRGSTELM